MHSDGELSGSSDSHDFPPQSGLWRGRIVTWLEYLTYNVVVFSATCFISMVIYEARGRELPVPRTYPIVLREVAPKPVNITTIKPRLSLFFGNGSAAVSHFDRDKVRQLVEGMVACGNPSFVVSGWVSSAPYRSENPSRSLDLARRRAAAVASEIRRVRGVSVERVSMREWLDYEDMLSQRHYLDDRKTASERSPIEFLNRRVDIGVIETGCELTQEYAEELLFLREKD